MAIRILTLCVFPAINIKRTMYRKNGLYPQGRPHTGDIGHRFAMTVFLFAFRF